MARRGAVGPGADEKIHQFGPRLRNFRETAELSRPQVAAVVRRDATTIRNWENGVTFPDLPDLLALQGLFKLASIELLLGGMYEFPSRELMGRASQSVSA